jgi:heavy metal sensor kinase
MTLTTRLSVFFLGALALVLIGFSATLLLLARAYLHRQVDDRLEAALNTLTAAAEIGPEGLEWEPHERQLSLGQDDGDERLCWIVSDVEGRPLSRSPLQATDGFLAACGPAVLSGQEARAALFHEGQSWQLAQRRIEPTVADRTRVGPDHAPRRGDHDPTGKDHDPKHSAERAASFSGEKHYPALVVTAGVSLEPITTKLRNLSVLLGGLSLGLWLLAAFVGRLLCRRALVPVTRMATSARAISAASLEQRLPGTGTADELEDLGRAFNDLLGRLQESFERQRRFTGDASHQLRTPLAAMLGQVEVALRRDRSPEEYRQVLALVNEQASHLRQLVEMLLFLARADAESRAPQLELLNLADWLPTYLRHWSEHPRASDLRMECQAGDTFQVKVHEPLLSQLLDNLVENACKYSDSGTAISLRVRRDAVVVALSVEDCGAGIAAEELPHIFEPFYRSAQARRDGVGGVGLGLAVAQRIACAVGGTLGVESSPGQITRFTLRIPAIPAPEFDALLPSTHS